MADTGGAAPYLPYGTQLVDDEDIEAVVAVLRGDWLTTGPAVEAFERALAARGGARHAIAVSNGTAALHTLYAAAGLGPGDEIVTSPLTFVATASAALLLGAAVRFADVEADTGNVDPAAAAAALTRRTRLVVAVDYAGHPADYDALRRQTAHAGVGLVADSAHSFGATYRGAPVGSLADATTLSFHPVKSITTAEGGAILTDSDAYARAARRFRNHGIVREPEDLLLGAPGAWYYEVQSLGLNYRLPDVLCALGLSQLAKLDTFMHRRRALARRYQEALADVPGLQQPVTRPDVESAWHLYAVRVDDRLRRDAFFSRLRASGIGAQVHYIPAYTHPAIAALGYEPGSCPVAEDFAARAVSIPLYPKLDDADADRVIATIRDAARATL
jgi:perosamine synthetase